MDDRLRETLSAMMDDEADELSVRRLLSHGSPDDVCQQWQRWQQVRDLMHDGRSPMEGIDVSAGVRAVLEGRTVDPVRKKREVHKTPVRWQWPAAAMAVGALFIGFGAGAGWEYIGVVPASSVAVSEPAGVPETDTTHEVALQGLDKEQWGYMNRYLLEHAQHNSVGAGQGSVGYARLVSANDSGH
ncbi:MAG TPA: RseA family anti-sigma factor [Marinobacter sp.]|nr:RseA family anti-sigma factor [Marinobacter sp.]